MFLITKRNCIKYICNYQILRSCFQEVKNKKINLFDPENFEDYFSDRKEFLENVAKRKLNLNVKSLLENHEKYLELLQEKNTIEKSRVDIADQIRILKSNGNINDIFKLKEKGKELKARLKNLLDNDSGYRSSKASITSYLLKLPAKLHASSPLDDTTTFEPHTTLKTELKSHLELLNEDILIKTHPLDNEEDNNEELKLAYLTGGASLFEYKLHNDLKSIMATNLPEYHFVSCSNMVKKFVTKAYSQGDSEGITILNTSNEGDHGMVLVGTSLPSFVAYYSSLDSSSLQLPYKCYSFGSNYKTSFKSDFGLYDLSQTKQGELFTVSENQKDADLSYSEQTSFLTSFYKSSQLPFKIVEVGLENLLLNESRRSNYFIWSPSFNRYFLCGHVISYGDCISRRFGMRVEGGNIFPHIITSVAFKVPSLMAAYVEQNQNKDCLKSKWTFHKNL